MTVDRTNRLLAGAVILKLIGGAEEAPYNFDGFDSAMKSYLDSEDPYVAYHVIGELDDKQENLL